MQEKIEKQINSENEDRIVYLSGKITLRIDKSDTLIVGVSFVKGLIEIKRSDIIVDGANAEIEVNVFDDIAMDCSVFFVHPTAKNVTLKNITVRVNVKGSKHSSRRLSVIYNAAYGLKLNNCHIEMNSDKQLNLFGIYNNGNLDTHMETRADNLVLENCHIKIGCTAGTFDRECSVYGLYNYLANSISVQNNFIYTVINGEGEKQRAVGVFTNGRFGRFVGNNIKANAMYNQGLAKEKAHTFGFINEGLYSIITSNNIVSEWAGASVGLENTGEYVVISSNKILSTHTIFGRTLINDGANCCIESNVITSTSRNARLIMHNAENCVISGNIMEVLMPESECRSGCGIYAAGENCKNNIIVGNIIKNVLDCAIFADKQKDIIANNIVSSYRNTAQLANTGDVFIDEKLDEKRIVTIYRE